MNKTAEKIRDILASQLDIDEDKITMDTLILEDPKNRGADTLGADSLDVVELMMSVEEEFGVTIDEEDVRNFKTVGDVAKYIDEKL